MQLEEFLQSASSRKCIKNITTSSKHKKIILDTLNSILIEHPEWETTLFSLAEYSKQKWALSQSFNFQSNDEIIKNKYHYATDEMTKKYETTEKIVLHIKSIIENKAFKAKTFDCASEAIVFEAAHNLGAKDASKFLMNEHYKNAIIHFCEKHNNKIVSLLKNIKKQFNLLESDEALIYHDTDILIKTIRYITKKHKCLNEIDIDKLTLIINDCIKKLDNFPFDGNTMSKIIQLYTFDAKSDQKIGEELFASETFVRTKRQQAIELISLLLWGYSSRIILRNI